LTIGWFWDGGINVRLGDEIGGYKAEEIVESVSDIVPWFQEAIASPPYRERRRVGARSGLKRGREGTSPLF
jgi:hypothetical protein